MQDANQTISRVFNEFLDVAPELTSAGCEGQKWVIRYQLAGFDTTEIVDRNKIHEESAGNGLTVISDADYMKSTGGKLLLQSSDVRTTQGQQTLETTMSVTYQPLGTLKVPASITSKTVMIPAGNTQPVSNAIIFRDCTIKN